MASRRRTYTDRGVARSPAERTRVLVARSITAAALVLWLGLVAGSSRAAAQPAIAAQPSGKILVTAVRGDGLALARLRRDGELDRRFGRRGFAYTGVPASAIATGLVVRPSGVINLAAQKFGRSQFDEYLVQVTSDGHLDRAFGSNGNAQPLEGERVFAMGDLELDGQDRLLVAAITDTPECALSGFGCEYRQIVARLSPEGGLDTGFGEAGVATTSVGGTSTDLAVAADDRVLVGSLGTNRVSRLTADGTVDPTFGAGTGWVQTTAPVSGMSVLDNGGLLVGGFGEGSFGATALSEDGGVEATYASDGVFRRSIGRPIGGRGSSLLSQGDLLLAGPVARSCGTVRGRRCRLSAALLRLDAHGDPVARFGDDGVATVRISPSRTRFDPRQRVQVTASRDGLRLATPIFYGSTRDDPYATSGVAIAAIRGDGEFDRSFGTGGIVRIRNQ